MASVAAGTMGAHDPRPIKHDTMFNAFSVTKPLPALAMAMLIDQGLISLDDLVAKHWPAFAANVCLVFVRSQTVDTFNYRYC